MEDRDLNTRCVASLYNTPLPGDDGVARHELAAESSRNRSPTAASIQDHPWDCRFGFGGRDSKRASGKIPDEVSVNAIKLTGRKQPSPRARTGGALGSGISLREWLKSESEKADKAEKLRMFRHIVHLVDFAHSQGSWLRDLRPSCFVVVGPANKVQYTGSLAMREATNLTRKRPMQSDCNGVKRQKLREAARQQRGVDVVGQSEKEWYASPEATGTFASNIYGLGVLLFELLCRYESWETHSAVMSDLQRRILPGKFLSENPIESAFCLRLLHPEILSRPTTREILQFELLRDSQDSFSVDGTSDSAGDVDPQSELLLKFFSSLKDEKESRAAKLLEDIVCLEEDIKGVDEKYSLRTDSVSSSGSDLRSSFSGPRKDDDRLMTNIDQLEDAYFSTRSQIRVEAFFDGLCKFSRFSGFKVCGTLRNGDLFNSTNAICSLSFDRDEEYIALAKVSKKIKIFEYGALLNDTADIHYPVVELSNKSKLSCICWNYYIKNYLASTDYDGVVKMWDASTGKGFAHYTEHQKRAWSVDFSRADPTMFASGSDDSSVRLWSLNDKSSIGTIWSPANVCCVQFSDYSSHQLVFGSADYKIYGYDLRHIRVPLYALSGHGKAVSYAKFVDAETIVSASTDNTLKLWDLKKSAASDDPCSLTFTGHTNEKNFVGLSVSEGYIVCGSETNEVYSYYRSLPMPITSHKFRTVDPVSGDETSENTGQFISSVCWRRKSNTVVAANSSGVLKLLQMV